LQSKKQMIHKNVAGIVLFSVIQQCIISKPKLYLVKTKEGENTSQNLNEESTRSEDYSIDGSQQPINGDYELAPAANGSQPNFKPLCVHEEIIQGALAPRRYGGPCLGNKTHTKECGTTCVRNDEPCEGKCLFNQCRNGDKCRDRFKEKWDIEIIWKDCNGHCQAPGLKCNGKCDEKQCWDEKNNTCVQYGLPGTNLKSCHGKCVDESQLCDGSCGNPKRYCWDQMAKECKSVDEKNQDGSLVRRGCDCTCIPYTDKCNDRCDSGQCEEDGKCLEELQTTKEGERIRTTCDGKCVSWESKCSWEY